MHSALVDEVAASPGVAKKELSGQHVGFQSIARWARRDDVAWRVRSALGERMDVVERGARVLERRGAIDAAASAVAQGGELDGSLVLGGDEASQVTQKASRRAGCAGKRDAMTVSSGQSHLARKDDTPRREDSLTRGVAHIGRRRTRDASTCVALAALASPTASCIAGNSCSFASGCVGSGMVSRWPISAVGVPFAQEAETAVLRRQLVDARRSSLAVLRSGRCATGSRNAAMMRAAFTSSTVRSGISEPAKGSGTSKPSP